MAVIRNLYPAHADLELVQGQGFEKTLRWYSDPTTLYDLTGYTVEIDIREYAGQSGSALLALTSADDEGDYINVDGTLDEFTVYIQASTTAALDFDSAVFDIRLTKVGVEPLVFMSGQVTLIKRVTVPEA